MGSVSISYAGQVGPLTVALVRPFQTSNMAVFHVALVEYKWNNYYPCIVQVSLLGKSLMA